MESCVRDEESINLSMESSIRDEESINLSMESCVRVVRVSKCVH